MLSDKKQWGRLVPYKTSTVKIDEPDNTENIDTTETIEALEDIASLQPGKKSQLAAKKISKKKDERQMLKKTSLKYLAK